MIHNQITHNTVRTAVLLFVLMLTTASAWAWSGNGTEADPYKIANYSDLKTLHDNVNNSEAYDGKYFKQTADIDWPANTTWTSGIGTDADHRFGGHYDGDGKAIRRLTISGTSTYTGLFGYVRGASYGYGNFKQTTLKNIVLEDCDIDASSVSGSYAAGICAFIPNSTRVDNCRVSGTISATSYASGITCIYEHSLIFVTNCFADVTVSALKIGKIFAEIPFSTNIVGNYYHDNGDGVGSNGDSYYLTASEAAPLYTVSGSGFTTAATNATVTHGGKHYFASGATVTLTTDDNHIITGSPAFSGTEATFYLATDRKSMTVTVGTSDVTVSVCSGTEDDPYLITNASDLQQLAAAVNNGERYDGKYFKQTADIDMTGKAMSPIGIGESRRFGGHYDGDGKAISHLTITGTTNYTALFGYICGASNGKDGYVSTSLKNIVLTDCDIDASSVSGSYAAGICAFTYKNTTVENCRVSGIIKGDNTAGGIVGEEGDGEVKNCFADVTVTASVQTGHYCTVGKIIGYVHSTSPVITGNYYHNDGATDAVGAAVTAFGKRGTTPHYDYSRAIALYTVSGTGLTTAATNATVTHAGTHYFAAGATVTLTTDDKLINDNLIINGMGASLGSVATDKKSMTVIVGTSDVTVSATLEAALCGDNAMWSISDTDGNGTYETLTISGSGAITSSPWAADFASSIQRVNISSADLTINDNPFSTLGNDVIIVVPTPAYAVGYSSAAYATKLRVGVGSQLFKVTGTSAADAAYEIATEADLRNLAAAVYQDRQTCYGLTFRQTAPITLSGTFMPIGYCNYSNYTGEYFHGTYDGSGNTISGLSISGDYYAAGLFGVVMSPGAVKNVHLISPTVTSSMSGACTGALIGSTNNCTVENCLVVNPTVRATASSIDNQVGALVGSLTFGTVQNCYVISPTVSGEGSTQVGAIFGNPYSFDHDLYCTLTNVYYYNSSLEAIGQHDNSEYSKVTNVGRAYTLTLGSGVTTNTAPAFSYNNVDYYYGTITLPAAPAGYIFTYTVNGNAISGNTFSISANSTVACTKSIDPAQFSQSGDEYTIHTAGGWNVFCDALQDNTTWNRFSGKTVKLGADITVTRMAGSGDNPFCGNFDGGGNTLTFTATAADNYCAPFVGVKGGTTAETATTISNLNVVTTITANDYRHTAGLIALQWGHVNVTGCNATVSISSTVGTKNPTDLYPAALVSQVSSSDGGTLTVTGCTASGTISTNGKYAAGLVGIVQGAASISDCISSVTINSSTTGDGTHGGIVAALSGATNIYGTVFNGRLLGEDTESVGGFIGWRNKGANIYNSLFIPTEVTVKKDNSATFARNDVDTHNCYYTYYLCDGEHYVPYYATDGITRRNGHATRTVAAAADVTLAVALSGDETHYAVSGITAYANGGIKRTEASTDTYYYGQGDALSLTLGNDAAGAPAGYRYDTYTASAGTLAADGTLTMPDADVTISVSTAHLASTGQPVAVAYVDADGTLHDGDDAAQAVALDGSETSLSAGTYFVGLPTVSFNHSIYLKADDITLILADGCTMNVGTSEAPLSGWADNGLDWGNSLTIYGQSHNTGWLNIYTSGSQSKGISTYEAYAQHGGNVNINSKELGIKAAGKSAQGEAEGDIIWVGGTVTIDGGTLTINADNDAIDAHSDITISGGIVSATSKYSSTGMYSKEGNITLGWTNATDRIYASYYEIAENGTVRIKEGKAFIDEDGTLHTSTSVGTLNGKTLQPAVAITLAEGITATGTIGSTGSPQAYYAKVGATVTIAAAKGYTISDPTVTAAGNAVSVTAGSNGTYSFTVPAADVTVQATVTELPRVAYIDENGDEQTKKASEYTVFTGSETSLPGGWYVVLNDISYNNGITFTGNAHLILGDGKTMTFDIDNDECAIRAYNITIYGQTAGTGKLNATGSPYESSGIRANGSVTINGGQVTASGGTSGIDAYYSVTINGGQVTATGHEESGIWVEHGNITLGWNRATDFIHVDSYDAGGTISIKEGKTFIDENGNTYSGTNVSGINGKTLRPNIMTLFDEASTSQWMTWCGHDAWTVPDDCTVYAVGSVDDATVTLVPLSDPHLIPAYTPVIVVRNSVDGAVTATFSGRGTGNDGVQTADGTTDCTFYGTTTELASTDFAPYYTFGQTYVLYNGMFLLYDTNNGVPAHRCWLNLSAPAAARLDINLSETTSLNDKGKMINDKETAAWYTLDGRKLDGKPAKKGMYVNNGQKAVIK